MKLKPMTHQQTVPPPGGQGCSGEGTTEERTPFVPVWLDDARLSATAFRVLCHLWRRVDLAAGPPWTCYPSAKTIAKFCRMKRDTVFAALSELEQRGMLAREQRDGGSNTYTLAIVGSPEKGDAPQSGTTRKGGRGTPPETGRGVVPKGGAQRFPNEGSPVKDPQQAPSAPGLLALTPEPTKTKPQPAQPEIPAGLDTPTFRAAWSEWLGYRRERRLGYKPSTLRRLFAQLGEWGEAAAAEAIAESIRNGWQGLFEPKARAGPNFAAQPPAKPQPTTLKVAL